MKQLKISLDYDETYTADRKFWRSFVELAKAHQHHVSFVTFRMNDACYNNADIEHDAKQCGINVVYSSGKPKRSVFDADIWIDDSPATIEEYVLNYSLK
jgi:hypothetical protein